jgi:hypothetical protein
MQIRNPMVEQFNSLIDAIEKSDCFPVAFKKSKTYHVKRKTFAKKPFSNIVVISNETNLFNCSNQLAGRQVIKINDAELNTQWQANNRSLDFEHALVISTNNSLAKITPDRFAEIAEGAPNSVFAIHDYDNHHWVEMSHAAAVIADVYFPAHLDSCAIASRLGAKIVTGVPCGTIQWSSEFVSKQFASLISTNRIVGPLGFHYSYPRFQYRNRVIQTFNKKFEKVALVSGDFHKRSPQERWQEWVGHKLHLISPVFNDLPIRFFDALVSGGLPLVPETGVGYLDLLGVPRDFYFSYSAADIIEPESLIRQAAEHFDDGGESGILNRHFFAMDNFHVDKILIDILRACEELYCH